MLMIRPVFLGLLTVLGLSAQPAVNAVFNAASYATLPQNNGQAIGNNVIAQGSIFVIFGTGLGPSSIAYATSLPLPTSVSGTSVSVSSGGQTVSAYVVYSLATQVAAILPSNTPLGPATVTVTYNGQSSASSSGAKVTIAKQAPGMFTLNQQGTGPAAAQVALSATNTPANDLTTPGTPGSVMILYGTGFGPISGPDNAPPGAVPANGTVTVTVGGVPAQVQYAGRSPQFAGLDQVNIQLPSNVPLGCYTPAVVTVNNVPSQDFVLSTASSQGSCVHPFGLSPAAEQTLDSGGTVNIGVFAALRGVAAGITAEGAGGIFANANASQVFATYANVLTHFNIDAFPVPENTCV